MDTQPVASRSKAVELTLALTLFAVLFTGCATLSQREREAEIKPEILNAYLADKPEALRPHYEVLIRQGQRNVVLNHMRSGLAAFELKAVPTAVTSLDEALKGIEAVYADNPEATKARGVFTLESYKDFKGEPYERAMAYYYRGLIYMHAGDYENARASFKGGMLQDAFAEEEQNRSDFAVLAFLEGWSSRCVGAPELAEQSFAEVKKLKPDFTVPPPEHNTLLLAETGTSPVKYADGQGRAQLKYRRGEGFDEAKVQFRLVDDIALPAFPMEDIYWQASTRGGRPVDHIMAGKVEFKQTAGTVGNVAAGTAGALLLAAALSRNRNVALAGAAVGLVALIAKAAEAASRTEADARYWETLPDGVHVSTTALEPGEHAVNADFLDAAGAPLESLSKTVPVTFAGRCGIAWTRSRSAVPTDPRAPNSISTR